MYIIQEKLEAYSYGSQECVRQTKVPVVNSGVGNFLEKLLPDLKPLEQNECRAMSSGRSSISECRNGFKPGNFIYL